LPASTWAGVPTPDNSGIQLFGSFGATDVVSFSSPVVTPVIAIVSPGQAGILAQFNFTAGENFVSRRRRPLIGPGRIRADQMGPDRLRAEGNGLVQFLGSYSSITWTNPVYENYYLATVAYATPEASTWAMMLAGFVGLGFVGYRARGTAVSTGGLFF
jgi:hypothetical protein